MTTTDIGFWEGILDVASGRGQLRLLLQPLIAIILGIRLGIADAKERRDPFVMRVLVTGKRRATLAKEAFRRVIVPFAIAVMLDGVLQYLTLGYVRPLAALVMGIALIGLPFAFARSITNRVYRRSHPGDHHAASA